MAEEFIEIRRDGDPEGLLLKLGVRVVACRHRAAKAWNWPVRSILLRNPDDELLKDDTLVLDEAIVIIASLRQWTVLATVCSAASTKVPCTDSDGCVEVKVDIPDVGPIRAFDLKDELGKRIGLHQSALILNQMPAGEGTEPLEIFQGEYDCDETQEPVKVAPPQQEAPPRPTTPEKFADDDGFEEILRLRRCCFEARLCALIAADCVKVARTNMEAVQAAAEQAAYFHEKEKPEEARTLATTAKLAAEAVKAAVFEADKEASQAAMKVPIAERALEAANAVTEAKAEEYTKAKEYSREMAKACQQARIQRKKVQQALEASKAADEDRDAKAQDLQRLRRSEDNAKAQVPETLALAQRAEELAQQAREALQAAQVADERAERLASLAEEAASQRHRAWLAEIAEFEKQGYGDPGLPYALRDDDILQELDEPCRRVLCRLRPRVARLFAEMSRFDDLFGVMGNSQSKASPSTPWSSGLGRTLDLLAKTRSSENGDLLLRAESPFTWRAALIGPRGSPYEGFFHWVVIEFTGKWPACPPSLRFQTSIFHCNVGEDGSINYPSLTSLQERWASEDTVFPLLGSIMEMFCAPHEPTSLRPELGALLKSDPEAYNAAAADHTRQHGVPFVSVLPNGPPHWYAKY